MAKDFRPRGKALELRSRSPRTCACIRGGQSGQYQFHWHRGQAQRPSLPRPVDSRNDPIGKSTNRGIWHTAHRKEAGARLRAWSLWSGDHHLGKQKPFATQYLICINATVDGKPALFAVVEAGWFKDTYITDVVRQPRRGAAVIHGARALLPGLPRPPRRSDQFTDWDLARRRTIGSDGGSPRTAAIESRRESE